MKDKLHTFLDVLFVVLILLVLAAILIDSISVKVDMKIEQLPVVKEKTFLAI